MQKSTTRLQYLGIRYGERLAENDIVASVAPRATATTAMAEAFNGSSPWTRPGKRVMLRSRAPCLAWPISSAVKSSDQPPVNAAWLALRFPAAVGRQLALSCRRFTGADLHRMGVALDVVGDDETLGNARRLAERIASYPASGAGRTKRIPRQTSGEIDGFSAVVARTGPELPSLKADPS